MNNIKLLPSDEETKIWFDFWIGKGCSASSAIYKFRNWLKEREQNINKKPHTIISNACPECGGDVHDGTGTGWEICIRCG